MLQAATDRPTSRPQTVGGRLAAARRRRKLSQRDVAAELGVTYETVSRWERDEVKVLPKYHDELCRILKLKLSAFNPY